MGRLGEGQPPLHLSTSLPMPFDPTLPIENTEIDAVQMRAQLTGLKDLIDAVPTVTGAVVDGVSTLPVGAPATVDVSISGGLLHFNFGLPLSAGEVSFADLDQAISTTSANTNNVSGLGISASDPPDQATVQQIINKVDELINALRR